jgi:glutathione S-transferase
MIKLYTMLPSGNSYKVRILLSLLNVHFEKIVIDHERFEHKTAEFRKVSPRGEVPVLEIDGTRLWDSSACLVYLARAYGKGQWLPDDPLQMAEVMQWLALAGNEIQFGLQYARRGLKQNRWTAGTLEQGQALGKIALDLLEERLRSHSWLALGRPTIADIACLPYVETAPEAGMDLTPYPTIRAWIARCKALPGWPPR